MAHRKAGGTAKNTRDSRGQRLGVKLFGGEKVKTGMIIVRQRGNKWHTGTGVKQGKDDTIYAMINGFVKFSRRKKKKYDGKLAWERIVSVVEKL